MNIQWRGLIALFLSGLLLTGCKTENTTQAGMVGVNREQRMAISSSTMSSAATKQYAQLMAEADKKGKLNADPTQVARVKAIADRLIAQSTVFRPDAQNWKWEVNVITAADVNAWCMPGGKIAVYTGLIEKLRLTDDELAAVMGHEVSHALREHSRERASEQAVASVGISVVAAVVGVGSLGQRGMEYAYQGLLGLPNSRTHEIEADRMGVELAARAGYDPRAAVSLWKKNGRGGWQRTAQVHVDAPATRRAYAGSDRVQRESPAAVPTGQAPVAPAADSR